MSYVSCSKLTTELAKKQDALADCNGNPIPAGTRMATCDDIPTVSTFLGAGQNTSLSGTGTEADPFRVGVATAGDTLPGIVQLATAANHPSTSDTEAATPAYVAAAIAAIPADPVSTMEIVGVDYVHTDENGVETTLEPSQFLSSDPDNAAGVGTDGRIKVNVPGQATDTQNGTVTLAIATNYPANVTNNLEATTPAYVAAALDDHANLVNGTNTTVSGTGTTLDPFKVNVNTATDTVPGISALAVAGNYPSTSDVEAATPAYVAAALNNAGNLGNGTNTAVTGTGTTADPFKVNVATATDTIPGIASLAVSGNYPSTSNTETATPAYVAAALDDAGNIANGTNTTVTGTGTTADPFKIHTPTSTLTISGVNYQYADETGATTVIQPGQFLSPDAGNAIGVDAQGRLKVIIPAQLPDDQVFSGDNSGTVALTLTPVVDPGTGNTNYTVKADLKLAALTPSGAENLLKWGPSGFYVELLDVFE
jgi:LysM repeat protein